MQNKQKLGLAAAILLLIITAAAAFFVIKFWSGTTDDISPIAPDTAAVPAGPKIQVGILLSDFSATGPRRQAAPYGYQGQLRAFRSLHDPRLHLVPVIEPNTASKGNLPRILSQNFPEEAPFDVTNIDQMRRLDVLDATANANLRNDVLAIITQRVSEGMGLLERQIGYLTPGYNDQTNPLCGFTDGVFGWNANPIECEIVGNHPLLGDLANNPGKTISLIPNGTVGTLKGIPPLRVKDMKQVTLVAAGHTVGTGEYLYPLYISQLGHGRIVGVGYSQGRDVPPELEAAHHGKFY